MYFLRLPSIVSPALTLFTSLMTSPCPGAYSFKAVRESREETYFFSRLSFSFCNLLICLRKSSCFLEFVSLVSCFRNSLIVVLLLIFLLIVSLSEASKYATSVGILAFGKNNSRESCINSSSSSNLHN